MNNKLKIGLIIGMLILFGFSAKYLYTEQLWGYWPLAFWGSLWSILLLLLEKRWLNIPSSSQLVAWGVASGLFLGLGFPPFPSFFFMFIGFVPLLLGERILAQHKEGISRWQVFKFGFIAFVTWNIVATYWVTNTLFVAGLLAIVPNSLLMSIPFVCFHIVRKRAGDALGYSSFVSFWLVFELIHLHWKDLSWPWLTLGNSLAGFPSIIQWYEITGVFGGSLWILLTNLLIFFIVVNWKKETSNNRNQLLVLSALIGLPILGSLIRFGTYQTQEGRLAEVVVVQPNYEPHFEKFDIDQRTQLNHFLSLSKEAITDQTEYLVFPETSFDGIWQNEINKEILIQELKAFVQLYPGLKLVTGLGSYKRFYPGDPVPQAPRNVTRGNQKITYESYNSAIQITQGQEEIPVYLKSKLVPGPELPPFGNVTRALGPLVRSLGGTMAGLGTQAERSVFFNENGTEAVAPVICYESIFGSYVTNYIKKGAQAIFVVTNDGWWGNTAGHKQHLHYASLRAIETRKWVARSANTGISAFINERGQILKPTKYSVDATVRHQINMNKTRTFYSIYGDLIARMAIPWSIFMYLLGIVNALKARIKKKEIA